MCIRDSHEPTRWKGIGGEPIEGRSPRRRAAGQGPHHGARATALQGPDWPIKLVDTPDAVCAGVKKTVALGDLTQRASRDHAPTTLRCDPSPASPSVKNASSRARTSGVSTRFAV